MGRAFSDVFVRTFGTVDSGYAYTTKPAFTLKVTLLHSDKTLPCMPICALSDVYVRQSLVRQRRKRRLACTQRLRRPLGVSINYTTAHMTWAMLLKASEGSGYLLQIKLCSVHTLLPLLNMRKYPLE